jgi:hypothetical protein
LESAHGRRQPLQHLRLPSGGQSRTSGPVLPIPAQGGAERCGRADLCRFFKFCAMGPCASRKMGQESEGEGETGPDRGASPAHISCDEACGTRASSQGGDEPVGAPEAEEMHTRGPSRHRCNTLGHPGGCPRVPQAVCTPPPLEVGRPHLRVWWPIWGHRAAKGLRSWREPFKVPGSENTLQGRDSRPYSRAKTKKPFRPLKPGVDLQKKRLPLCTFMKR